MLLASLEKEGSLYPNKALGWITEEGENCFSAKRDRMKSEHL